MPAATPIETMTQFKLMLLKKGADMPRPLERWRPNPGQPGGYVPVFDDPAMQDLLAAGLIAVNSEQLHWGTTSAGNDVLGRHGLVPSLPAAGFVNPVERPGKPDMEGWRLLVYRNDQGNIVTPEWGDNDERAQSFAVIPAEMTVHPLPEGITVAPVHLGKELPQAYALKDGRLLVGTVEELRPQLAAALRQEQDQFGPVSGHDVALFCRDVELAERTAPAVYACMRSVHEGTAHNWVQSTIWELYRDTLQASHPAAAGDRRRGAIRHLNLHLDCADPDKMKAWLVVPSGLAQAVGVGTAIPCPLAEATMRGLGIDFQGWVDGGDNPYRWQPPTAVVATAENEEEDASPPAP